MAALDTNVLVRFLVKDDTRQLAAARNLLEQCVQRGEALLVPITVALELEWVLRSRFGIDKESVIAAFSGLLASVELRFEAEGVLEVALALYAQCTADFSDCIHIALARAAGEQPLWTFDRTAARVEGARLLLR